MSADYSRKQSRLFQQSQRLVIYTNTLQIQKRSVSTLLRISVVTRFILFNLEILFRKTT